MHNIKDFGRYAGVVKTVMSLQAPGFKWITYPAGTSAIVAHPADASAPLDSVGIQAALDAARDAGGGTVIVPAGDYVVGTLRLWSDIELRLEAGARLWASPNLADYIKPGMHLIHAENATNAHITGHGEIHCQSPLWVIPWLHSGPTNWAEFQAARPGKMFVFDNCRDVSVEGIKIFDSPNWTLVFSNCRGIRVDGITMRHFDAMNADGIDLVDSQNAVIANCNLHVTDDAICMKSDISSQARDPDAPGVANIAITNCVIRTLCNAIKIGTESTGRFENITVSNIAVHNSKDDIKGAEGGINIALCDGGLARGISFNNFVMNNVECPFYLVTTPRRRFRPTLPCPAPGKIDSINISNIIARNFHYTPFVMGCPNSPAENISVRDIALFKSAEFAVAPQTSEVHECAEQYPTPFMFGSPEGGKRGVGDGLPAHGLYMRDVANSSIANYKTELCDGADARPMFEFHRCHNISAPDAKPH